LQQVLTTKSINTNFVLFNIGKKPKSLIKTMEWRQKNLLSLPIPLTGHVHVSQDVEWTALLNAT
jgi:hypothetical protein